MRGLWIHLAAILGCILLSVCLWARESKRGSNPHFNYDVAREHEIKPHRRTVPFDGAQPGFNQLSLTLTVSPEGDVIGADASGDKQTLEFWPKLKSEVSQWKFTPFERNEAAVTAEVEEYIDLVPPERLPTRHLAAPVLKPNSNVTISLERTGCYGSCSSYTVSVSTAGVLFEGKGFVVATGKHTDTVDANQVRNLAKSFVAADFYSMDTCYRASVTDSPTYFLSISIDGHDKQVEDYVGSWEGMPAVITDLEEQVDALAGSQRWTEGAPGLVAALEAEKFDFKTSDAQVILKSAASRGQTATVEELLDAGVPLKTLPRRTTKTMPRDFSFVNAGWLSAASRHPEALQLLIDRAASKNDQKDKDQALAGAAASGEIESARALIGYGADPNADLRKLNVTTSSVPGSILIYAARSGNPDMVREILRFHPQLETRDEEGQTAVFAVEQVDSQVEDSSLAECIRLLAEAGADVNARDNEGNTPLHEAYGTDVEMELLKHGADVNARNDEGETPIFSTVDDDAIWLYIEYGADLTIRNKQGKTVVEAAEEKGPLRQEALEKAIQRLKVSGAKER